MNERETLVVFGDETRVFSVPNRKFIETAFKNANARKILITRKSDDEFFVAFSDSEQTKLILYSKN